MKRKIVFFMVILAGLWTGIASANINSLLDSYIGNQAKVKTFIGKGNYTMQLMDSKGAILREIKTPVQIYMKHPDLFKLVVLEPKRSVTVQHGDVISQQIADTDQVVSQKANGKSNMFKNYFGQGLETLRNNIQVESQSTVKENGRELTVFRCKVTNQLKQDSKTGPEMNIDRQELYFEPSGMVFRTIVYSGDKELVRTETGYVKKDDIYLAEQIKTVTSSGGTKIITLIKYDAMSVNTTISDKEFELK